MTVEIVGAYVEGLPMPSSSSFLTSEASENLNGGLVKNCVTCTFCFIICSPAVNFGSSLF